MEDLFTLTFTFHYVAFFAYDGVIHPVAVTSRAAVCLDTLICNNLSLLAGVGAVATCFYKGTKCVCLVTSWILVKICVDK